MHFKAKAFIKRFKLEQNICIIVRIQRIQKGYGEDCLKTAENWKVSNILFIKISHYLDGHYLLINNLSFHKNGERKIFITVIEKTSIS